MTRIVFTGQSDNGWLCADCGACGIDGHCEWMAHNCEPKAQIAALAHQEGGNHYKNMAIQPVEFIHKNGLTFIAGNVIKYVCRYEMKNGIEDLKKARHYIDLLIEMESK